MESTDWGSYFNQAADVTYGSFCCLCFLIGTVGNITSFLYFKSKKRDMSSVLYITITLNDLVVSVTILPVGISFLSERSEGFVFGPSLICRAWTYIWELSISLSIFLVMCLCITRTMSLFRPFKRQKIRYMIPAIVTYLLLRLAFCIVVDIQGETKIMFYPFHSRCNIIVFVFGSSKKL